MKSIFKFPLDVPRNSPELTPSKLAIWQRVFSTVLILPFTTAGMGWFPETAQAQTFNGNTGCPAGTKTSANNILVNGDFSQGNTGFSSDLTALSNNTYGEGYTVVNDTSAFVSTFPAFAAAVLDPKPFPGDPANNIPASNSYYYSNPSNQNYIDHNGAPTLWRQTVTVTPNTTYKFLFYIDNVLRPGAGDPASGTNPDANGYPPVLQLNVSNGGSVTPLGSAVTIRSVPDQWVPIQVSFTTGATQTSATLSLADAAGQTYGLAPAERIQYNAIFGDDFAFTSIGLNQCVPNLGVAKSAGTPVKNANGTYTIPYTVTVKNYGVDALSNLQLTDDLTTTFANASNFTVANLQSTTSGITVKPSYDGRTTNPTLLAGTDTLAAGATATVTFNAIVTPGTGANGSGPFNNSVKANATAPGNIAVSDDSVNGTDPDPDNDKDPSNNTSPTVVTLPQVPSLGVAESAAKPTNNNDGSYTVPYTFIVRNYGTTPLSNVQVTDNFATTFASAKAFNVVSGSIVGTGVTVNPNFNGTSNTNLLTGVDTLQPGQSQTITVNVRVTPGGNLGVYNNNAIATGSSPNAILAQDTSTNGADPAPDPSGDPTKSSVPTPVSFTNAPRLRLIKRITNVTRSGSQIGGVPFANVDNSDADTSAVSQAGVNPVGVRTIELSIPLQSGDEVEYTIYFLSDGGDNVSAANLCDPIPTGTSFVNNSVQAQLGSTQLTSNFFSPLAPLPAKNSCPNQTNPSGAVLVNLGNLSTISGGNAGFVRFRVKID